MHDLLFADYDAGLMWFRAALLERSPDESIIDARWTFAGAWDPEAAIPNVVPSRIWRPRKISWPAFAN